MKTRIASILSIVCLAGLLTLPACKSTLAPGGAYAPTKTNELGQVEAAAKPDLALYYADKSFDFAYSAIDTAFLLERNNRTLLWSISPNIKHTLDEIRPQAVAAKRKWALARVAYLSAPVPANMTTLQDVIAEISRLQVTATAILPK